MGYPPYSDLVDTEPRRLNVLCATLRLKFKLQNSESGHGTSRLFALSAVKVPGIGIRQSAMKPAIA